MPKATTQAVQTVLTIAMGFLVIFLITDGRWAVWTSLALGLVGMFSPYLSRQIDYGWMKLSELLGLIVPRILMSAIFFLILTPLALLSRVFGKKDPLMLKNPSDSTFRTVDKTFGKEVFEKPW